MSVTLSQSELASFDDRTGNQGLGMHVDCSAGGHGVVVEHRLDNPAGRFHSRFLFQPNTISNGKITLLAGLDAAQIPRWQLHFHPATRVISLELANIATIESEPLNSLAWHCVEMLIDVSAGCATLWIDGLIAGNFTATFDALANLSTLTFQLGCVKKETEATGEYFLDEWIVAEQYIGPVSVNAQSDFAEDPARWLVIYNNSNADSITWAQAYRTARRIPWSNLLGLHLPMEEIISPDDFSTLVSAVNDYLQRHDFWDRIEGVLLGFGVPGYVNFSGSLEPLGSLLHSSGNASGLVINPLACDLALLTRPTCASLQGLRLASRLDAPTLEMALEQLDHSTQIMDPNAGLMTEGKNFLNPYTTRTSMTAPAIDAMVRWSASLERMRTHLTINISDPSSTTLDAGFETLKNDGFFWGWTSESPAENFFDPIQTPLKRIFCCPIDLDHATAPTLRDGNDMHWNNRAAKAGYAASAGTTGSSNISQVPRVEIFFQALRQGWTLAEAWFLASPFLRHRWFLTGDPLLHVHMPQQGWELHGPMSRLENLQPENPSRIFRSDENSLFLPQTLHPQPGENAFYLLRGCDEKDRKELSAGSNVLNVIFQNSQFTSAHAAKPVWPDVEQWRLTIEQNHLHLPLIWADAVQARKVRSVELWSSAHADETLIQIARPEKFSRSLCLSVSIPIQPAKFRWKITDCNGVEWWTPWSETFEPSTEALVALNILETP